MLSAINEQGKIISLLKMGDLNVLNQNFFCPICHNRVILKTGSKRRWHFAHYHYSNCGATEAETEYHLKGKEFLYEWFSKQNINVALESYFPTIKQRADLYITFPFNTPIEFQCSTITSELFLQRTSNYQKIKKHPIWILGGNRLKRVANETFRLHRMDWLALIEKSDSPQAPFLLYFCPETDGFALLTNFIPYSSTKVIANLQYIKRKDFKYEALFEAKSVTPSRLDNWSQVKKNWRTYQYRRKSTAFRYVSCMLQSLNRDIPLFPSEAGLHSQYLFWIETPPHLWQSWLLIQCLYPIPKGQTIQFQDVYTQFKRLVKKRIFLIRTLPLLEKSHYSFAIMSYLLMLCDIGVLNRIGKSTFKKIQQIELPKTLDVAMQMDEQIQTYLQ